MFDEVLACAVDSGPCPVCRVRQCIGKRCDDEEARREQVGATGRDGPNSVLRPYSQLDCWCE